MHRTVLTIITICLLYIPQTYAGQGPDLKEGEWKITVDFSAPGLPMKMPSNTYTQCIKKDQPVPKSEKPNQSCDIKDTQTDGNTVKWSVECTNRVGKMTGKGAVTYSNDKMSGTMTMSMDGQGAEMVSHYRGVRIGNCR